MDRTWAKVAIVKQKEMTVFNAAKCRIYQIQTTNKTADPVCECSPTTMRQPEEVQRNAKQCEVVRRIAKSENVKMLELMRGDFRTLRGAWIDWIGQSRNKTFIYKNWYNLKHVTNSKRGYEMRHQRNHMVTAKHKNYTICEYRRIGPKVQRSAKMGKGVQRWAKICKDGQRYRISGLIGNVCKGSEWYRKCLPLFLWVQEPSRLINVQQRIERVLGERCKVKMQRNLCLKN